MEKIGCLNSTWLPLELESPLGPGLEFLKKNRKCTPSHAFSAWPGPLEILAGCGDSKESLLDGCVVMTRGKKKAGCRQGSPESGQQGIFIADDESHVWWSEFLKMYSAFPDIFSYSFE